MPKCPECKEEIDYLVFREQVVAYYIFRGELASYELEELVPSRIDKREYLCPRCDSVLFEYEEDALYFLKEGRCIR